jgi:hypothetical protein
VILFLSTNVHEFIEFARIFDCAVLVSFAFLTSVLIRVIRLISVIRDPFFIHECSRIYRICTNF